MPYKIVLERKGTQEKVCYGADNYHTAKQIYKFLQENKNQNNDFLIWVESAEYE